MSARLALLALLLLLLSACQSLPSQQDPAYQPLLLISIDGLRPQERWFANTPNLDRLAQEGVHGAMQPVFPSYTFPNHYSLVTGLSPARHGIVANRMIDPRIDATFTLGNREQVTNPFWWQGEPIWITAERQGVKTAPVFWPGSEVAFDGTRPSFWEAYEHERPYARRVNDVLAKMALPPSQRPQMLSLYFSEVDSAGHDTGPGSADVITALEDVDRHLGDLITGMQALGIYEQSHILVVSDHGMSALSPDRRIFIDDYVALDQVNSSLLGPVAFLWPEADDIEAVLSVLENAHPAMRVLRSDDLPPDFGFRDNPRIPPLVGLSDDGWVITHRDPDAPYHRADGGAHGYDPRFSSMRASFIARSPRLQAGKAVATFSLLDVYPLMAELLGIRPADHEGSLDAFEHVLRNR
jgi:predicted AlkP superfamily pyrophosphatase or phosphodiesterase